MKVCQLNKIFLHTYHKDIFYHQWDGFFSHGYSISILYPITVHIFDIYMVEIENDPLSHESLVLEFSQMVYSIQSKDTVGLH
jgi:hypothetical protein